MDPDPVSHQAGPIDDDGQLVRRCQRGDGAAFEALVLRHQQQAFAVALRMLGDYTEAKEVAQDAFVSAYRAIGNFRQQAKFSTWLLTIVTNLCRNRRRWWARRKRFVVASLDDPLQSDEGSMAEQVADPSPGPSAQALNAELRQHLIEALGLLDASSRAVVVLRDVEGLSYEEIAHILRCQVGTVKSRLNRARLRLRALLDGRL